MAPQMLSRIYNEMQAHMRVSYWKDCESNYHKTKFVNRMSTFLCDKVRAQSWAVPIAPECFFILIVGINVFLVSYSSATPIADIDGKLPDTQQKYRFTSKNALSVAPEYFSLFAALAFFYELVNVASCPGHRDNDTSLKSDSAALCDGKFSYFAANLRLKKVIDQYNPMASTIWDKLSIGIPWSQYAFGFFDFLRLVSMAAVFYLFFLSTETALPNATVTNVEAKVSLANATSPVHVVGTEYCLGNEVPRLVGLRTRCLTPEHMNGVARGNGADTYAFGILAVLMLVYAYSIQVLWQILHSIFNFRSNIVTVDANIKPSATGPYHHGIWQKLRGVFSLAYDPKVTPIDQQTPEELYCDADFSKLFCEMHAEMCQLKFSDGPAIRRENFEKMMSFEQIVFGYYVDQATQKPYRITELGSQRFLRRMELTKKNDKDIPEQSENENVVLNQQLVLQDEQAYLAQIHNQYLNEIGKSKDVPPRSVLMKPVEHYCEVPPDTMFPWACVSTSKNTTIASYRAQVTNVLAVIFARFFLAASSFLCFYYEEFPAPLKHWAKEKNYNGLLQIDAKTRTTRSMGSGSSGDYGSIYSPVWSNDGYTGTMDDSPSRFFLVLGIFFSFQTVWISASFIAHDLLQDELKILRHFSRENTVNVQQKAVKSRYVKYFGNALTSRIKGGPAPKLLLLLSSLYTGLFWKEKAWLEVGIGLSAFISTLLYYLCNVVTLRRLEKTKVTQAPSKSQKEAIEFTPAGTSEKEINLRANAPLLKSTNKLIF